MPTSQTNEQALEATIQKALTGTCLEELKEQGIAVEEANSHYRGAGHGFFVGNPSDFNAQYAIDERRLWHFLETSQKEELEKLQRASDWKLRILQRLERMIKKRGVLYILKKGLAVDDAKFIFLYELPLASSGHTVKELSLIHISEPTRPY